MHFDAVGAGVEVDPPHRAEQRAARYRPVGNARQIGEQVEFAQRQANLVPRARDAAVDQVDVQIARAELPARHPAAPRQAGDARDDFGGIIVPPDRIVGAAAERRHPVGTVVAIGQDKQRPLRRDAARPLNQVDRRGAAIKGIDDEQVEAAGPPDARTGRERWQQDEAETRFGHRIAKPARAGGAGVMDADQRPGNVAAPLGPGAPPLRCIAAALC